MKDCDGWDEISCEAKDFILKLMSYDPCKRPSAEEALKDTFITKNTCCWFWFFGQIINYLYFKVHLKNTQYKHRIQKKRTHSYIHQLYL